MEEVVISVKDISKKYRVGLAEEKEDTFVGEITHMLSAPFRTFKQIKNLSSKNEDGEDIFWALRDISFEVKKGEVLGIIGHNGAGKSTLLKILSRITYPTSGSIEITGRVSSLLEVGTGFHPELTGKENIYMNGTILGMTKKEIDSKFDEIVEFSGIKKHLNTPVKRYSSGMKVRLAFSVAAHLEPEILIIDEVLAVGDAEFQRKCLGKMQDVAGQGRTVLFVSHNMVAVQNLCNRIIWLNKGQIKDSGETSEIVKKYLSNESLNYKLKQNWDNEKMPGNDIVKLKSIEIFPKGGNSDFITMETEFDIEITFLKLLDDDLIDTTIHFITEDESVAFSTSSLHINKEAQVTNMYKGVYKTKCTIPANLLNNIAYRTKLLFIQNKSKSIFSLDYALNFEINENKDQRGNWYGKRIGVIRPKLNWNLEKIQ
jgi:lipopolysaccharide transport system ATP-binding protein